MPPREFTIPINWQVAAVLIADSFWTAWNRSWFLKLDHNWFVNFRVLYYEVDEYTGPKHMITRTKMKAHVSAKLGTWFMRIPKPWASESHSECAWTNCQGNKSMHKIKHQVMITRILIQKKFFGKCFSFMCSVSALKGVPRKEAKIFCHWCSIYIVCKSLSWLVRDDRRKDLMNNPPLCKASADPLGRDRVSLTFGALQCWYSVTQWRERIGGMLLGVQQVKWLDET